MEGSYENNFAKPLREILGPTAKLFVQSSGLVIIVLFISNWNKKNEKKTTTTFTVESSIGGPRSLWESLELSLRARWRWRPLYYVLLKYPLQRSLGGWEYMDPIKSSSQNKTKQEIFKDTFAWLFSDTLGVKIWFSNCNAKPLVGVITVRSVSFLVLWPRGREHQHSPGEGRNAPGCSRAQPKQPEIFFTSSGWQVFFNRLALVLWLWWCATWTLTSASIASESRPIQKHDHITYVCHLWISICHLQ